MIVQGNKYNAHHLHSVFLLHAQTRSNPLSCHMALSRHRRKTDPQLRSGEQQMVLESLVPALALRIQRQLEVEQQLGKDEAQLGIREVLAQTALHSR